ncbi:hypothetical protein [Novosphingobium sp. AAP93]|uniref:hypothetical protein n=1 Tax=Novosphingobium sp. AAP93 TaxID=1523427 RepID=UPI0012E16DE4|nr:hypothetical protein [Novosphingobium sp. AAP93]
MTDGPKTEQEGATAKPTHDLTSISGESKGAQFTRVAALWPTKDCTGFMDEIPAGVTITGRVGVLVRKDQDDGRSCKMHQL